jgi:hypothetical protein
MHYIKLAQHKLQWLVVKTFSHHRSTQKARNLLTSCVSAYQVLAANSISNSRTLRHNVRRHVLYTYMYICPQDQSYIIS